MRAVFTMPVKRIRFDDITNVENVNWSVNLCPAG